MDRNFGDSARNKHLDVKTRNSNHIFDGAGENVQYFSDSESLGSRKSKTRYINAAIYVETVESTHSVTSLQTDSFVDDVTPHPHGSYRSSSTPFLTGRVSSSSSSSIKRKSCKLGEDIRAPSYDAADEETPRDGRTYRDDGADTFRLSVASVSTTTTAKQERERNEQRRQEAFKQWVARKEAEKREKARQNKQKIVAAPTTSPEQREESYRRWLERKRMQKERRRADEIMRQYRQTEKLEQERQRREREKEEKLQNWIRKKEEDIKAMKTAAERKAARAAIEEQRRRSSNEKAYRDWLRTSKNKPLPVPLNQGELIRNLYFFPSVSMPVSLNTNKMNVYQKVLVLSMTLFAQFLHQLVEKRFDVSGNMKAYDDAHRKMIALQGAKAVKSHQILVLLLRLRQVCCHCGLIAAMLDPELEDAEPECASNDLLAELNKLSLEDGRRKSGSKKEDEQELEEEATTVTEAMRVLCCRPTIRSSKWRICRRKSKP